MTNRERAILAKLSKLMKRRDVAAWRLGEIDRLIGVETRRLASERGSLFIRPESVRLELNDQERWTANG